MHFLEELKQDFIKEEHDNASLKRLEKQLEAFLNEELKSHYAEKFMQKYNKITFFDMRGFMIWETPKGGTSIIGGSDENENYEIYKNGIKEVCELIDDIIKNFNTYKKDSTPTFNGDYVVGNKAGGDIVFGSKAGGDIVFGDKSGGDKVINDLKEKLNQGVENQELREELMGIAEEIRINEGNKEKRQELVNKLWERGAQVMTILGPFAPYLFK